MTVETLFYGRLITIQKGLKNLDVYFPDIEQRLKDLRESSFNLHFYATTSRFDQLLTKFFGPNKDFSDYLKKSLNDEDLAMYNDMMDRLNGIFD